MRYRSCDVCDDTLWLRYFYDVWGKYVLIWENASRACVSVYCSKMTVYVKTVDYNSNTGILQYVIAKRRKVVSAKRSMT